jgi:hypothetical protein
MSPQVPKPPLFRSLAHDPQRGQTQKPCPRALGAANGPLPRCCAGGEDCPAAARRRVSSVCLPESRLSCPALLHPSQWPPCPLCTRSLAGRMDASAVDSLSLDEDGQALRRGLRSLAVWLSPIRLPRSATILRGTHTVLRALTRRGLQCRVHVLKTGQPRPGGCSVLWEPPVSHSVHVPAFAHAGSFLSAGETSCEFLGSVEP